MEIKKYLIKSENYRNLIKNFFLFSLFLTVFIRYNRNELFTENDEKYEKIVEIEQLKLFCEKNQCILMKMEESERWWDY